MLTFLFFSRHILKTHHQENSVKISCHICDKKIIQKALKNHIQKAHVFDTRKQKHKCRKCDERFFYQKDLKSWVVESSENFDHLNWLFRHHLKKHYFGQTFECHCGSVFKTGESLISHQSLQHSSPVTCMVKYFQRKFSPNLIFCFRFARKLYQKLHCLNIGTNCTRIVTVHISCQWKGKNGTEHF